MVTYCLKSKRNTKSIDSKMLETNSGKLMLSSSNPKYDGYQRGLASMFF